jgi:hypothetical protein
MSNPCTGTVVLNESLSTKHSTTSLENSHKKCCGIIGKIFGHKYYPRFSKKYKVLESSASKDLSEAIQSYIRKENIYISSILIESINDGFSHFSDNDPQIEFSEYEGDVCSRCGNVVNNKKIL